jgi:hypothetical protein
MTGRELHLGKAGYGDDKSEEHHSKDAFHLILLVSVVCKAAHRARLVGVAHWQMQFEVQGVV